MAEIAQSAVFSHSDAAPCDARCVHGPTALDSYESILRSYPTIGFQASNYATAVSTVKQMLHTHHVCVAPDPTEEAGAGTAAAAGRASEPHAACEDVLPTLFVGAAANLFGTGCREAIRFLCKESLISVLVVSGGAFEHDIRRAVEVYTTGSLTVDPPPRPACDPHGAPCRFGNVTYPADGAPPRPGGGASPSFGEAMERLVGAVVREQQQQRSEALSRPIPDAYDDVCAWSWSPSRIWRRIGELLPGVIGPRAAETTVLWWAVQRGIPVFCPSFADGDIAGFAVRHATGGGGPDRAMLQVDLVKDIHELNRTAMLSKKSGMLILGGGVVKHHVCNANLMRNGADWAVFINQAQEFDGSDAGARPDEAVSWGKIRMDAPTAKVYAEVSLVLPLLVAEAFLPAARARRAATPGA